MEEIEKLRQEIKLLKFSTEKEFNEINKRFEDNLKYIQSETEKTESMIQMTNILKEFMQDVHISLETKKIEINTINIRLDTFETMIKNQDLKFEILKESLS